MRKTKIVAVASLLLFGAAGCDLDVTNSNAPDRSRALANPTDVQALVSGAFWTWYNAQHNYGISMSPALSNMAFQHASAAANWGQVDFSATPRAPLINQTSWTNYVQFSGHWTQYYRSIAAVNAGLAALDEGTVDLGDGEMKTRAYARFIQGISHGTIAILFERGPIVDENTDLAGTVEYVSSRELLDAAIGFLDDAISISTSNTFTLEPSWFGGLFEEGVTNTELARMASSYKAMLRASWPRTSADASTVNWQNVLNEVENGIQETVDFTFDGGSIWFGSQYYTSLRGSWHNTPYTIFGMADQSGKYQEWMSLDWSQRHPDLPSGAFLIITPDTRFPQGATLADQIADVRPLGEQRLMLPTYYGEQWARPDRGTWRWSYYRHRRPAGESDVGSTPYISYREQRLLAAEAHYRLGDLASAASIINESRVAAGLNATDAQGTNTSCVPKLPNGDCGDLWEMLKWERRMEASHEGHYLMASMYFDSRRWGDLMEGTIIDFPVPCRDAQLEGGMACEDRGGVGNPGGAARGTYGY